MLEELDTHENEVHQELLGILRHVLPEVAEKIRNKILERNYTLWQC